MKVHLLDLRPTQIAIGGLEVKKKIKKIKKMSARTLNKSLKKEPLLVVLSPDKKYYLVDGHHRALALWTCGIHRAHIKIIHDFSKSKMSYNQFWHKMIKNKCTHLYDAYGEGPHKPFDLPQDLRGLGDDPYRSLAWLTACKGGFKPTKDPFAKFNWAIFFRKRKLLRPAFDLNYKSALKKALVLAHMPSASKLPGFISKSKSHS